MKMEKYKRRILGYLKKLKELLKSDCYKFDYILKNKEKFDFEGVYIISKPENLIPIYAGKTDTKKISGRVYDHKTLSEGSDLKGMVKNKPNFSQNIEEYNIRFMEIKNDRKRMLFENFIISALNPELNKTGRSNSKKSEKVSTNSSNKEKVL